MVKITRKLIKEIVKMDNPTDQDYTVLWRFIHKNLLKSVIEKPDKLTTEALKKYNTRPTRD